MRAIACPSGHSVLASQVMAQPAPWLAQGAVLFNGIRSALRALSSLNMTAKIAGSNERTSGSSAPRPVRGGQKDEGKSRSTARSTKSEKETRRTPRSPAKPGRIRVRKARMNADLQMPDRFSQENRVSGRFRKSGRRDSNSGHPAPKAANVHSEPGAREGVDFEDIVRLWARARGSCVVVGEWL
jgi:hypothetical protein